MWKGKVDDCEKVERIVKKGEQGIYTLIVSQMSSDLNFKQGDFPESCLRLLSEGRQEVKVGAEGGKHMYRKGEWTKSMRR
jgi:hypothetical protein